MKKRKDPFNAANAPYNITVNQLYNAVNANAVAWGIDPAIVAAILAVLTPWNTFYAISKERSTSTATDRENTAQARKALNDVLRPFVQSFIYRNALMTNADIITCGLNPYDRVKTPVKKPATVPDMDYRYTSNPHQINAFYKQAPAQPGVSRRGKPLGVGSVKIVYFIGDNPPADPAEFNRMKTGTRTPVKLQFNPLEAGRKVTFAACWVSTSLIDGEWTGLTTMFIP